MLLRTARRSRFRYQTATILTVRGASTQELPAGVCGRVEGIALVYDVVDSYGTTFAQGCLEQTIRQRVALGKVKLYVDHGDVLETGTYDTHLHIGVVREVWDDLTEDGRPCAKFRADIFDTEAGRKEHEYLTAVAATKSETGVSIGMLEAPTTTRVVLNGVQCDRINKVALREISITGESSVPGTKVTAVRQDATDGMEVEEVDLDAIATAAVCRQTAGALDACAAKCEFCRPSATDAAAACRAAATACDTHAQGNGSAADFVTALATCAAACVAARNVSWYCYQNFSECRAGAALADTVVNCFRAIAWDHGADAAASAVRAQLAPPPERPAAPNVTNATAGPAAETPAAPPAGAPEPATEARAETRPVDYFRLLDGIVAHVGLAAVRAHLGATISDASAANSDAVRSAPPTADSLGANSLDSSGVSRGGTEPPAPNAAPMAERLAFARAQLPRLYTQ